MDTCVAPLAALLLAASVALPAHADDGHGTTTTVAASELTVVDGDTVRLGAERIRLIGPDAPEISHPRCDREIDVANQATDRLRDLIAGQVIRIERHGLDRYRRTLANLYRASDNAEVGELLIASRLAVRWQPGREAWLRRAQHWCGHMGGEDMKTGE